MTAREELTKEEILARLQEIIDLLKREEDNEEAYRKRAIKVEIMFQELESRLGPGGTTKENWMKILKAIQRPQ